MTRLFEKEYGLPVNSNPTDPRSRVRTFRMAALCSPIIASRQHRLHSSNRCVGRTLTLEDPKRWEKEIYERELHRAMRNADVDPLDPDGLSAPVPQEWKRGREIQRAWNKKMPRRIM